MQYKLQIELLSDMCPASGEAYNSTVDTDIDYDAYGFPFLSAKRIKGCLRENAQMLKEWGKEIHVNEIFGTAGNQRGSLRLGSAKIKDYEKKREELDNYYDKQLTHPQNILALYSYTRTQTAMENGVARKGSLRVLRVLKKGLIFEAEMDLDEKYFVEMEAVCKSTRNMGLNRTRGLGEVKISIAPVEMCDSIPEGYEKVSDVALDNDKTYRLSYRIKLTEAMILKSYDKGQEKTQDYIEGTKMLGIIAGAMGNEEYRKVVTEGKVKCSNLYVTESDRRYIPVKASLRRMKDDKREKVFDLAAGFSTTEQTQGLGNVYADIEDATIRIVSVDTGLRYHHSRPEDKSIGRALGDGKGEFYQMSSICEGQTFGGFIQAKGMQMKQILSAMKNLKQIQVGYGKASEYGRAELLVDEIGEYTEAGETKCREFVVQLISPIIMYNGAGMYTQEPEILEQIISNHLGTEVVTDMENMYLNYTKIGGWQTMWNRPKQIAQVLDKGTVIVMRAEEDVNLPKDTIFAGERTSEGYGEILISEMPVNTEFKVVSDSHEIGYKNSTDSDCENTNMELYEKGEIISALEKFAEIKMVENSGRSAGRKLMELAGASYAPTINKLLLTLKEQRTESNFKNVCNDIKTESKSDIARKILKKLEDKPKCIHLDEEKSFEIYMKALLTEAKYIARTDKGGSHNE